MSSAMVTVASFPSPVAAAGDGLDLRFAVDVGAYTYGAFRLKLWKIDGSPSAGTATIQLQTSLFNEDGEYKALIDKDAADAEFTINYNDSTPRVVDIIVSDRLARYLRWVCTDFSLTGGTNPSFAISIEGIVKTT